MDIPGLPDQTRPTSTSFTLVGPGDPALDRFCERIRKKRRLNSVPRLWGYRDRRGALWIYDPYEGERVIRWIETFCRHRKGEWAGRLFKLAPWQKRIVRQLFGWFGIDGLRKHREAWLEIPRKNGKSTLCAAIGLYLTIGDREPASEVYCVAASELQAQIVYGDAKSMVDGDQRLLEIVDAGKKGMLHGASDSRMVPKGKTNQHGLSPHGVIGDEVHEWPNGDQYEAMDTAKGARRQPLHLYITTAGWDMSSICGELHKTALRVIEGVLYRPDLYVKIFAAAANDNWQDEEVWHKANPGLKHGAPKISAMRAAAEKAKQSKSAENSFKRLHLNIWTDNVTAWIRREDWSDCRADIPWESLVGARCYAGLDIAKVQDISALALLFPPDNPAVPGRWLAAFKFWCPEENIIERSRADGIDYKAWADRGLLTATPGNTTDFDCVEDDIIGLGQIYKIEGLGFDPFLVHQMVQHIDQAGVPVVEIRQGFLTLGPPTAEIERKVIAGQIAHGGHEVMDWMVSQTQVATDAAGNVKPHKGRSGKIDGVAALVNAAAIGMTVEVGESLDGFLSGPIVVNAA